MCDRRRGFSAKGKPSIKLRLAAACRQPYADRPRAAGRVGPCHSKGEALVSFLEPRNLEFHQDDKFDAPAVYWRHE